MDTQDDSVSSKTILVIGTDATALNLPYTVKTVHTETDILAEFPQADLVLLHSSVDLAADVIAQINTIIEQEMIPLVVYGPPVSGNLSTAGTLQYIALLRGDETPEIQTKLISTLLARSKKNKKYRKDSELLDLFLAYNTSYVFFKDQNARVLKLSENYIDMLGIPAKEALGKNMNEIFPSELAEKMVQDDLKILQGNETVEVVEELHGKYYKTSKFPVHRQGRGNLLAGFTIDITDLKTTERQLMAEKHKAELLMVKDELSGIYNRRGFLCELDKEIKRIKRYGGQSSLLIFDIDNFKNLNDTLGHFKADMFLKDVAAKVENLLRENDSFGRIGGDEFAVICSNASLEEATAIAERILKVINLMPLTLDGETYHYSISMGLTIIDEKQLEMNELLQKADVALYNAKQSGRNCFKTLL